MMFLITGITLALSLFGIFMCRLVILHTMGRESPLGTKLCGTGDKFNCNKVLGSGFGRLSENIHLGDVGLIYFIAQALFAVFEVINGKVFDFIAIITLPCLFALALTFVLLLYQGFIIKAWCRMCLLAASVVWLQAIVIAFGFAMKPVNLLDSVLGNGFERQLLPSFLMFVTCILIASTWLFIKAALATANEVKITNARLSFFKKNAHVFRALLKTQRTIHAELWADDFFLGNKDAPIQFIMALNPYCPPCAREYKNMMELLDLFPDMIGITIRFFVILNKENEPTTAVKYLLHEYACTPQTGQPKILERWFESLSLDRLKKLYPRLDDDQNDLLKKHQQWLLESGITHTPSLFINGSEFPKPYTVPDLKILIKRLSAWKSKKT